MKTASSLRRQDVPCESDEHVFRPEVYELPVGDLTLHDERCLRCGWTWDQIADHDQGWCCCPGNHATMALKDRER